MDKPKIAFWPFVTKALGGLAFAYIASRHLAGQPFGFVVGSVLIFAIPVALAGAYTSAVEQTHRRSYYKEGGWVHKFLSRRFLGTFLWLIWALLSSFFVLLHFSSYSGLEWIALVITIPVFWVVYSRSYRILFSELKRPYVATRDAINWARRGCPLLMVVIYLGLVWALAGVQSYDSLAEALASRRAGLIAGGGSALVEVALRLMTFADGSKSYLADQLKQYAEFIPLLLMAAGAWVVFFHATATFACFVIPRREYRRVFGPLCEEDNPPPLSRGQSALNSALVTFVMLFVYLPLFAQLEESTRRHPEVMNAIKTIERKVEQIDKEFYNPGTIEKVRTAKAVLLGQISDSKATLLGQVDRAFALMEGRVDRYLDWYYRLTTEYMRLAKLLTGEIEGYMEDKLSEYLEIGDLSGGIERGIEAASATHKSAMDDYQSTVKGILDSNRIAADGTKQTIVSSVSLSDMLALPNHAEVVAFNTRVAGGALATGIGAVVTGKIVSKTVFKTAAKAVTKAVTAKAAGTATGAAVGGVIGSVIPGAGTLIGGAIGAVIGGVATDAVLLKLEEAVGREDFKKEILTSIQQAREEFKAKLFPPT